MQQHDLLQRIDDELKGLPATRDITIGGHTYGVKVLDRSEESYSKTLIPAEANLIQALSDTSAPVLAVALRSIDGTPVEDIFGAVPDDATAEQREQASNDLVRFRRLQIKEWLCAKPGVFIQKLWLEYLDLKSDAEEALESLDPLSTKTPSSELRPS